jgi:predicted transcriptional regulator
MEEKVYTTVQMEPDTRNKLRELAAVNFRTMSSHLKYLIAKDYEEWQNKQPADKVKSE